MKKKYIHITYMKLKLLSGLVRKLKHIVFIRCV